MDILLTVSYVPGIGFCVVHALRAHSGSDTGVCKMSKTRSCPYDVADLVSLGYVCKK